MEQKIVLDATLKIKDLAVDIKSLEGDYAVALEAVIKSDKDYPEGEKEKIGIKSVKGRVNYAIDPVEEVILHYDSLDGAFVKTFPLHETQQILSDDPRTGLTVRLDLKITNDFVMELLSRSRSLEVLAPMHLRERVKKVFDAASERNK